MEALLTVKEAAEITRLKTKTLYAYAERRIIPHPWSQLRCCSGMQPNINWGVVCFLQGRNLRDGLKVILFRVLIPEISSFENTLPDDREYYKINNYYLDTQ